MLGGGRVKGGGLSIVLSSVPSLPSSEKSNPVSVCRHLQLLLLRKLLKPSCRTHPRRAILPWIVVTLPLLFTIIKMHVIVKWTGRIVRAIVLLQASCPQDVCHVLALAVYLFS